MYRLNLAYFFPKESEKELWFCYRNSVQVGKFMDWGNFKMHPGKM